MMLFPFVIWRPLSQKGGLDNSWHEVGKHHVSLQRAVDTNGLIHLFSSLVKAQLRLPSHSNPMSGSWAGSNSPSANSRPASQMLCDRKFLKTLPLVCVPNGKYMSGQSFTPPAQHVLIASATPLQRAAPARATAQPARAPLHAHKVSNIKPHILIYFFVFAA